MDVQLVGLNILPCKIDSSNRDVSYILMTRVPLAQLRGLYRKDLPKVEVQWMVDCPDMFSFVVFKKDSEASKRKRFLCSLSAFHGISEQEGQVLGLSKEDSQGKTFIFLTVKEPAEVGGLIYLPTQLLP